MIYAGIPNGLARFCEQARTDLDAKVVAMIVRYDNVTLYAQSLSTTEEAIRTLRELRDMLSKAVAKLEEEGIPPAGAGVH